MDPIQFMTSAVFSGALYDMLSNGVTLTANSISERFRGWIIDEATAKKIASQIEGLALTDEMSEKAIERRVLNSQELLESLSKLRSDTTINNYTQSNKYGDNVMLNVNKT